MHVRRLDGGLRQIILEAMSYLRARCEYAVECCNLAHGDTAGAHVSDTMFETLDLSLFPLPGDRQRGGLRQQRGEVPAAAHQRQQVPGGGVEPGGRPPGGAGIGGSSKKKSEDHFDYFNRNICRN